MLQNLKDLRVNDETCEPNNKINFSNHRRNRLKQYSCNFAVKLGLCFRFVKL